MKVDINDKSIYFDGYLKSNLDLAKKVIKKDWDMCFIVDGMEGAGKSVLAQQIAFYLDNTLSIERICFNPTEFREAVLKAKKYEAIIYDEAYGGLASRRAMNEVNITLIQMMAEIRQKNLYIVVVLPCFFELDKYLAIWRSRLLLHVYTGAQFERGYFSFYNYKKKKALYVGGKKFYIYGVKPNFRGRFTNKYAVDEDKYRTKKHDSLVSTEPKKIDRHLIQRNKLILWLTEEFNCTHTRIADKINLTPNAIDKAVVQIKKE